MKRSLVWSLAGLIGATALAMAEPAPLPAVHGLIERLLPGHARHFVLEVIDKDPGGDVFELASQGERIVLRGNNGVSLASALDSVLHEYALRQWSGMFRGFYRPRWEKFLNQQLAALRQRRVFEAARFETELRAWEEQWTHQTESYAAAPQGNPVTVARRLLAKYRN